MAYDICSVCGRFFPKEGQPSCPECREQDNKDYEKLHRLIKSNPGMMVFEASNLTGIPVTTIMRFVNEKRIFLSDDGKDSGKIHFRDEVRKPRTLRDWETKKKDS